MITIVDYNAGNLRSVKRACDAVGIASVFTQDPDVVRKADRLIFAESYQPPPRMRYSSSSSELWPHGSTRSESG